MGTAEQYLAERLEFALAVFEHRTHVVCEEIGLDVRSRCDECPGCTAIALEFGLDSDHVSEEIRERAAPAVERKAADNVAVLRVKPHVGIVPRYLHLGVTLRERCAPEKQDESSIVRKFGMVQKIRSLEIPVSFSCWTFCSSFSVNSGWDEFCCD